MFTRPASLAFVLSLAFSGAAGSGADSAALVPTAAGRAFSATVQGQGKPMILIPGLSCGGEVWNGTVLHFKDRYQCHVLTLAGFAGQPAIGAPMLETIRREVASYIREQGLTHPIIVGHSLGGFLSYWVAASEPDLVGPIIAVDGGTFLPALMNPTATLATATAGAAALRAAMAGQTAEQFSAQNRVFLSSMITDPKNVELIAPACAKSDPKAVALAMYELMTTDLRDDASRIKTPVLLIGSGSFISSSAMKDTITARYEAQVAKIPHHKVILAEKARHFIMLDDPQFLFAAMETFLGSSER